MKKLLAAFSLFGALMGAEAAPIVISFVPALTHIAVGQSVSVDVMVSGLDDEILSSYDVDMLFDNSVLSNGSLFFPFAPWGGDGSLVMHDAAFLAGRTQSTAFSLLDDDDLAGVQANSFMLLRFSFTGLTDGFSLVNFGLDPDFERNFVGRDAASLDVTVIGTCVAVGAGSCENRVPEPASLGLLGIAALGGVWASRRSRRKS